MAIQTRGFGVIHNRNKLNEAVVKTGVDAALKDLASTLKSQRKYSKGAEFETPEKTAKGKYMNIIGWGVDGDEDDGFEFDDNAVKFFNTTLKSLEKKYSVKTSAQFNEEIGAISVDMTA